MALPIISIIEILWLLFVLYWLWGWRRVKGARRSEPVLPRVLKYWLPLAVGIVLILPTHLFDGSWLAARFYAPQPFLAMLGALFTLIGIAFACWARLVLGRNWSAVVQVKQDHELIQRGPYGLVRHPIYSGLLLAFAGTALAIGEWRGVFTVLIVAVSFWFKLRLEERWMRESFGPAYDAYMRRVKALIPGVL